MQTELVGVVRAGERQGGSPVVGANGVAKKKQPKQERGQGADHQGHGEPDFGLCEQGSHWEPRTAWSDQAGKATLTAETERPQGQESRQSCQGL